LILLRKKPPTKPPEQVIPAVRAKAITPRANYRVRIVDNGSVRPRVQIQVVPQVSGEVVHKADNFRSGKYVKRGQVLFRIDQTDYSQSRDVVQKQIDLLSAKLKRLDQEADNLRASEKLARSRVALAKRQWDDALRLKASGAASSNDVDVAEDAHLARTEQLQTTLNLLALIAPQRRQLEAEEAVSKAQLAQAQTALARTEFLSPISGRVLSSELEVGTQVQAGKAYGQLYTTDVMEVPVSIPASDLEWIDLSLLEVDADGKTPAEKNKSIPAKVTWRWRQNGKTLTWRGYVGRREAGLKAETRTATLVVYVANPTPDLARSLDRNMFCTVTIHGRKLAEAFMLPRSAILPEQAVYVVANGRLKYRKVSVARFTDDEAMILPGNGIEAGDVVCTGYVPEPVPDKRVKVVPPADGAKKAATSPASSAPASRRAERAGATGPTGS